MVAVTKHIKLLAAFAALLFTIGSSGVAIVIHTCTMTPQMTCCERMLDDTNLPCTNPEGSSGGQSIQTDMTCSVTALVGGFTTNPGVVDNNHQVQTSTSFVVPSQNLLQSLASMPAQVWMHPFLAGISPPSLGKHILNSALLI